MSLGFIKEIELVDEKVSSEDHFDASSSIEELNGKFNNNLGSNIIGVVGAFGIGKSTLIELYKKKYGSSKKWIHFDAWQFPDRKELWEGLILETAKADNRLSEVLTEIEGKGNDDKKTLINVLGDGINLLLPTSGEFIKYFTHFVKSSPATRVFQLQNIFKNVIEKIDEKDVIFVLEDTDRSGQDGLFFIETLKSFLSKNTFTKNITVIVTISDKSYFSNLDTYVKCLDYVEFYNKKQYKTVKTYLSKVLDASVVDVDLLAEFFENIMTGSPDFSIRKLKLVLRQANLNYLENKRIGRSPHPLVCICVATSKYILDTSNKSGKSYFENFLQSNRIPASSLFNRILFMTNSQYKTYSNEKMFDHDGKMGATQQFEIKDVIKNTRTVNELDVPRWQDYGVFSEKENKGEHIIDEYYFKNL